MRCGQTHASALEELRATREEMAAAERAARQASLDRMRNAGQAASKADAMEAYFAKQAAKEQAKKDAKKAGGGGLGGIDWKW